MPDEGRELVERRLCNRSRWLKCARGVVAARRTGHDDERYARALIVGRREGVAAIVAGYAAVRENDIELWALQRCMKRIAGIDRQYVAVEAASGQRRAHEVRVRG